MRISVIIPTLNEENNLSSLLPFLKKNGGEELSEIIVCDGGSTDSTKQVAEANAIRFITCKQKGRHFQMNKAASVTRGDVLYFLHADTQPPASFVKDIKKSLGQGFEAGCFQYEFKTDRAILKRQARLTKLPYLVFRGGDQSLYITRDLFQKIDGFDPYYFVMEDYDIIRRLRKHTKFNIIPKNALVSARKYENNSYLRVNFANVVVFSLYYVGVSPKKLLRLYFRLINHPKAT